MAALCPGVRCIFISGYAADIFHKDGLLMEKVDFLTKPIAPSVLLKKVREVLDRRPGDITGD
jgi:DNA-binding response OmpR family regulator